MLKSLTEKQKKVLKILLIITIICSIVFVCLCMSELHREKNNFIEERYLQYKTDDVWKEFDQFKKYKDFDDFWSHEKNDGALKFYFMYDDYKHEYVLHESWQYENTWKFKFNTSSEPFKTLIISVFYVGICSMITIIPYIGMIISNKKKEKKKNIIVNQEKNEITEHEKEYTTDRKFNIRLRGVTGAPTYGILAGVFVWVFGTTNDIDETVSIIMGIVAGLVVYFVIKTISFKIQRKILGKVSDKINDVANNIIDKKNK